jgi:acetylornithine deacetylase
VTFRTVSSHDELRKVLRGMVGDRVLIDEVLEVPPVKLETPDGFDTAVFAYTTDIPFLDKWGKPLLLGPGSIHVAHTDREHVSIGELRAAIELYVRLAGTLLQR